MFHSYTHTAKQTGGQTGIERHAQRDSHRQILAETDRLNLQTAHSPKPLFMVPLVIFLFSKNTLVVHYMQKTIFAVWCGVVWCIPCAGCCGTALDPYRERMESLERGFLVESSALLLLFSLNRSRSDWTGADPAVPAVPEVAPTPGTAATLPAALVEFTCTDQRTWSA